MELLEGMLSHPLDDNMQVGQRIGRHELDKVDFSYPYRLGGVDGDGDAARIGPSACLYARHGNGEHLRDYGRLLPGSVRLVVREVLRCHRLSRPFRSVPEVIVLRGVLPFVLEDPPAGDADEIEDARARRRRERAGEPSTRAIDRLAAAAAATGPKLDQGALRGWREGHRHALWRKFLEDHCKMCFVPLVVAHHAGYAIQALWHRLNRAGTHPNEVLERFGREVGHRDGDSLHDVSLYLCVGALKLSAALHGCDGPGENGRVGVTDARFAHLRRATPLSTATCGAAFARLVGWRALIPAPDHFVDYYLRTTNGLVFEDTDYLVRFDGSKRPCVSGEFIRRSLQRDASDLCRVVAYHLENDDRFWLPHHQKSAAAEIVFAVRSRSRLKPVWPAALADLTGFSESDVAEGAASLRAYEEIYQSERSDGDY